jgi:hypothetical protein
MDSFIISLVYDKKICTRDYFLTKKMIVNKSMSFFSDPNRNLDKPEKIRCFINSRICERKANRYVDNMIVKFRLMKLEPINEE